MRIKVKATNFLGSSPIQKVKTNDKELWTLQFDGGSRGNNACNFQSSFSALSLIVFHYFIDILYKIDSIFFYFEGNPGCAGSGCVIYHSTIDKSPRLTSNIDYSKKSIRISKNNMKYDDDYDVFNLKEERWYGYHYVGPNETNNVAEYSGLIEGLKQVVKMNLTSILIQGKYMLNM